MQLVTQDISGYDAAIGDLQVTVTIKNETAGHGHDAILLGEFGLEGGVYFFDPEGVAEFFLELFDDRQLFAFIGLTIGSREDQ